MMTFSSSTIVQAQEEKPKIKNEERRENKIIVNKDAKQTTITIISDSIFVNENVIKVIGHDLFATEGVGKMNKEEKAMLGVMISKDEKGALIVEVLKSSSAEKEGLKEGDIITQIDRVKIAT